MIILKSRLQAFLDDFYNEIGTEVEWEKWEDYGASSNSPSTVHIYGADLETKKECDSYEALEKKYGVEE